MSVRATGLPLDSVKAVRIKRIARSVEIVKARRDDQTTSISTL